MRTSLESKKKKKHLSTTSELPKFNIIYCLILLGAFVLLSFYAILIMGVTYSFYDHFYLVISDYSIISDTQTNIECSISTSLVYFHVSSMKVPDLI